MDKKQTKRNLTDLFGEVVAINFSPKRESGSTTMCAEIGRYNRRNADKHSIDDEYLSRNFPEITEPLQYGVRYLMCVIPITGKDVSYAECISFLKKNKFMLAGPSVYPVLLRNEDVVKALPYNKWLMSIDTENHCYNSRGEKIFHCLKLSGGQTLKTVEVEIQPSMCRSLFGENRYYLICFKKVE